jgi:Zn2+/Cd2+-exporting ATPase
MNGAPTTAYGARSYRVRGMDCAEEIAALKKEVGPLVGGAERLSFNLLAGKMVIEPSGTSERQILQAVQRAGLTAEAWGTGRERPRSRSQRYARGILCVASGLFLAAGLAVALWREGNWIRALAGAERGIPSLPVAALYGLAIVAGAWFVVPKALHAARALRADMNLLMTLAVVGALAIGEWFEAATVTFLFSFALLLESWSVSRARRAIGALMDLSPQIARCRDPRTGELLELAVENVPLGSRVLVRPGEKVPLDGEVTEGETSIDQSPITGESIPVAKSPGEQVFAGTINGDGVFELRTTKPATETTLARIISLVEEAQGRRAPSEQWVERFARLYTPGVLGVAVLVAVVPPLLLGGAWTAWLYKALVLLVIACPCALVISTPVSIVSGLTSAARAGVLIKGGAYLEAPSRWRAVAFDKTGTVTYGRPRVQRIIPLNGHSSDELLSRAAALEADSTHPLARAVLHAATQAGVSAQPAARMTVRPGRGAEGDFDGRGFWIGSHRFMEEKGAESDEAHRLALEIEDAGHSLVAVGNDNHVCGLISVADEVRSEASAALRALEELGISPLVLLTGDNRRTGEAVGRLLGLQVQAELLPEEKVAAVTRLASQAGEVAMVGDGVNDAPALAASSCGVAMGAAGTDAALETADVALMSDDLSRLPWLVRHSRRTVAVVRQNIGFALAVKVLFMALAVAGSATLWMAIAADMGASLLVIFNGLRLLRAEPPLAIPTAPHPAVEA